MEQISSRKTPKFMERKQQINETAIQQQNKSKETATRLELQSITNQGTTKKIRASTR